MRFVKTAIGHRVLSNKGGNIRLHLKGCRVQSKTPKGYFLLVIPAEDHTHLTDLDRQVKRGLDLPNGPWNPTHGTLAVKVPRTCSIVVGGEPVGDHSDLLCPRDVEAEIYIGGAWPEGYLWSATRLTLGTLLSDKAA